MRLMIKAEEIFSFRIHALVVIVLSLISSFSFGQIGGKKSFEFINTANSARLGALGGINVSLADKDLNFFSSNPALAGDTLSGVASASYQFYMANIGQAFFSYAHDFNSLGMITFGVQHINYGTIKGYDASGIETTDFNAGETALIIGKSHTINAFRLGASLKTIFSNIAGYRANAMAIDLGGVFIHPDKDFTVGLAIKNLGFVFSDYSATSSSKLPFDVQVGTTFKPEHMPLRFSITAYNLTKPDVVYYNASVDEQKPKTLQKILGHVNFGSEILIHRNVNILVGYNYLLHRSLKLEAGGAGAGFSFGFSARVKAFEFVFSRSGYVAGSAGYSFSLSTNVNKILKRR
jgi:hypothetical protein